MTINSLVFNDGVSPTTEEYERITSNKGKLHGGSLKNDSRIGDIENRVSLASSAVYIARGLFKEAVPYYRMYDVNNTLTIGMSLHFIIELRRQLSGTLTTTLPSVFSPDEEAFYTHYKEWFDGIAKSGELLQAIEALDDWLIDELTGNTHPNMTRTYDDTHKWYKTGTRG